MLKFLIPINVVAWLAVFAAFSVWGDGRVLHSVIAANLACVAINLFWSLLNIARAR